KTDRKETQKKLKKKLFEENLNRLLLFIAIKVCFLQEETSVIPHYSDFPIQTFFSFHCQKLPTSKAFSKPYHFQANRHLTFC
ncbi:MAG: hypothetical protein K2F98_06310, partial [Bacteroides sp.]|nr:hypothetical protein [Bacteroides sp.]